MKVNANESTTPLGTPAMQACDPRASAAGPTPIVNVGGGYGVARVRARDFRGRAKLDNPLKPVWEKLRVASWNVGTMTAKSADIEDVMERRGISIMCVQETKWRNNMPDRARFLTESKKYKLYYYGEENNRNGVGVILARSLLGSVISVSKESDRLISVKVVVCGRVWNIISAYAPQSGLEQREKVKFWNTMDTLLRRIPDTELVFIGGDLNGHVGEQSHDYEDVHGGKGSRSRVRDDEGEAILAMSRAHGLVVLNTWFVKQERHLITYCSGAHATQIDYHLCLNFMRRWVRDCKVIIGESAVSQHRLLLTEFILSKEKGPKRCSKPVEKIKWHNLKNEAYEPIVTPFIREINEWLTNNTTCDELSPTQMWNNLSKTLLGKAEKTLGVSKGRLRNGKESWWWNDEIAKAVEAKTKAFKAWTKCESNVEDEKAQLRAVYDECRKSVKRMVAQARAKSAEQFYQELESQTASGNSHARETPRDNARIYRIAAQRRRNAREIETPKFIEDSQGTLLTDDKKICARHFEYFRELLNEEFPRESFPNVERNLSGVSDFNLEEVKRAVMEMKRGKAVGPDKIPVEFWLETGDCGLEWLTVLFNKIKSGTPMPDAYRKSHLLPFYKNKGDSRKLNNYRAIKLTSHTLKIYERVVNNRLKNIIRLHDSQCGFVEGKSTTDAIQCLRILMEKYRDARKDLFLVFIDLEKAFDRVPRELIWLALRAHNVPEVYVRMIMDMYDDARTRVRCTAGESDEFTVKVGVHQGSVLSPMLFNIIMSYLLKLIGGETEISLLFADDVVLGSTDIVALQNALSNWDKILKDHGLKISVKKTEFLPCQFSDPERPKPDIYIGGEKLTVSSKFKYLGSVVNNEATCDDDIKHRTSVGWMKWRENSSVFCDKKMPRKLKGKLYATVVRPALLYASECWTMYDTYERKLDATEMKMLRMTAGVTKLDHIKSKHIRGSLFVQKPITEALKVNQTRWYCHVQRRPPENPAKKAILTGVPANDRRAGRPKYTWISQMKKYQQRMGLSDDMIQDRNACRRVLRSHTHTSGGA